MTKTKLGLFAIPFLATIMISAGISAQFVAAAPATVGMDSSICGLLDGNGNAVDADRVVSVVTNNGKGTGKLTCHASGVAPPPSGHAVKFNFDNTGLICGTPSGDTTNWQNIVSANGESTLQCKT